MKLTFLFLAAGSLFAADVALTFGIHSGKSTVTNGGRTVEANSSTSVMLTPAGTIANFGVASLGWEVPIAFGGPAKALIGNGRVATEKLDFLLVPGARLRLLPGRRLSPWASVGLGVGRFDRASVSSVGNAVRAATDSSFTVAVGAGADLKLAGPLFLRGEIRNFNYKSLDDLRRNSFLTLVGFGFRW